MKLPNAEKAIVEREKIVDYLLNAAHPDNGGKAAFLSLGFGPDRWSALVSAFCWAAETTEVTKSMESSPVGSIFLSAAWKHPAARQLGCERFGLLTADRMRRAS